MRDRRSAKREHFDIFINKHVDGFPYACRAIDISRSGILVRRLQEPAFEDASCSLEIGWPGSAERIWVWANTVHSEGNRQALRFVGMSQQDQEVLEELLAWLPQAA